MRAEQYWRAALDRSRQAATSGDLAPLSTERLELPGCEPFVLRRLLGLPPRHLREPGPRPNPFLPWERPLEVSRLGEEHLLLLNKYPVQEGHLLLITQNWWPQSGWLNACDWQAVADVTADTGGLWFFNSSSVAGASQPHRHLQLLPRPSGQPSCPLAAELIAQLEGKSASWPWAYRLERRGGLTGGALRALYERHCHSLGLGSPGLNPRPRHPYNLLFDDDWFLTIRRVREHGAGFSVNALGFAGYLLLTGRSDLDWLRANGPLRLLQEVAAPSVA
ncbi:ATP adenylyltransferase [Cyanobium sp. Morenito 9A2]|uniref:ATP adenylyltransferase n=1 Tax=Cyanobium sp. Morenito 9A2 TaxID=2823718 RepID=UPI0020CF56CC|nr:ATP adenylyltransferase [Cyanobium sp. Morenito 9A2]MCP9850059.1 ATP adenylyltransferase [Cyanobium sp. Morenito 9A2]